MGWSPQDSRTAGWILLLSQTFPFVIPPSPRLSPSWLPVPSGPWERCCVSVSCTQLPLSNWDRQRARCLGPLGCGGKAGLASGIRCRELQKTVQSGPGPGTDATSWETEHEGGAEEASPSPLATAALLLTGMKAKGGRREPRAWPQTGHQLQGVTYLSTLSFLTCKRERIVNSAFLTGACRAQRGDACEALGMAPAQSRCPFIGYSFYWEATLPLCRVSFLLCKMGRL